MERPGFSKFLFIIFGILVLVLGYRLIDSDYPEYEMKISNLERGTFSHYEMTLSESIPLIIDATGSFENDGSLAVYGWIVKRDIREVVWNMTPENVERNGSIAHIEEEKNFVAGEYDVFFTTLGDPAVPNKKVDSFLGQISNMIDAEARPWYTDDNKWHLSIGVVEETDDWKIMSTDYINTDELEVSTPLNIWHTKLESSNEMQSYDFEVLQETSIQVQALLALNNADRVYIEKMGSSEVVWELSGENTTPAGGAQINRKFDEVITMPPGRYRIVSEPNSGHYFDSWVANPPLNVTDWGVKLTSTTPIGYAAVRKFDPWVSLQKLVEIRQVQNDSDIRKSFDLNSATTVMISAMGEIISSGSKYDYAWLVNNDTDLRVWEMDFDGSIHAGGSDKNRLETVTLDLPAGSYTVHYKADGSHAWSSWNDSGSRPRNDDRWGVTVFSLEDGIIDTNLRKRLPENASSSSSITNGPDGYTLENPTLLVDLTRIKNSANVNQLFVLAETTPVLIKSVGELTSSEAIDFGWIENAETKERVWQLERGNSQHAGGDWKNRKFEGVITLPAGEYLASYTTDESHAFDSFNQRPPNSPESWGIAVYQLQKQD